MRSLWSGALVIGHVTIPVSLHKSAGHVDDVSLRQLHATCGAPLAHDRNCPTCGVKIAAGDDNAVTRGVEVSDGVFVPITPEELDQAIGGREVIFDRFLPDVLLRPEMLDTTYWVAPGRDALARRAYDAFMQALDETSMVGIGRLAISTRERVAAVRALPVDGAGVIITLTTLFPVAGVRQGDAADIRDAIASLGAAGATTEEVTLFAEALKQRHVPAAFRWRATQRYFPSRLRELVDAKQLGGTVTYAPAKDPVAPRDLTAALRKTVRQRKRAQVPA